MPKHIKGESRKDWMKRCIPYVIKKEGLSRKEALGKCGGMYDSWKKKQRKHSLRYLRQKLSELKSKINNKGEVMNEKYKEGVYYDFKFDSFTGNGEPTKFDYVEFVEKATSEKGYNMVIAIGNRFMKGVYVSTKELKAAHRGFNNTMHDLNHMGSGYAVSMFSIVPPDISYIVGWQDGLSYDNATDEVRANVHIEKTAVRYDDWKNYIDISAKIGRVPNVSMFVYGKIEYIEARKLPKNSHYQKNGYKADDVVPCMTNIIPFMVSTVTMGTCDDKKGCGIKQSNDCSDGTCTINQNEDKKDSLDEDVSPHGETEKAILKRRKYVERRLNNFKGEK